MGVNLKRPPTERELSHMIKVWDDLRESSEYVRTLHDTRMYVEVRLRKLAEQLGIRPTDVSVAVTRLESEGYVVRHALGSKLKPTVIYIRANNAPYHEANPKPLPEGYYIPHRKVTAKPIVTVVNSVAQSQTKKSPATEFRIFG